MSRQRVPWAKGEMGGALLLSGQSQVPCLSQADWFKFMCNLCRILISMCQSLVLINWWEKSQRQAQANLRSIAL